MQTGVEVTAAEGELEASGSMVGVTGVTDVIIGDGGSGATGERATMLMVCGRQTEIPNVCGRASVT